MKLVFVSTGTPTMARDFREALGITAPVWVDKHRETYRHLGFKRGIWRTLFSPRTLLNALRATRAGFRQGKTQGDPWQQGGVLVVRRGGAPVYAYAAAVAGDHPPTAEVLGAARQAATP